MDISTYKFDLLNNNGRRFINNLQYKIEDYLTETYGIPLPGITSLITLAIEEKDKYERFIHDIDIIRYNVIKITIKYFIDVIINRKYDSGEAYINYASLIYPISSTANYKNPIYPYGSVHILKYVCVLEDYYRMHDLVKYIVFIDLNQKDKKIRMINNIYNELLKKSDINIVSNCLQEEIRYYIPSIKVYDPVTF